MGVVDGAMHACGLGCEPKVSNTYVYQAPLLPSAPVCTPRSTSSPVRLMPWPKSMSICTLRNGGASLFLTTFTATWLPLISSPFLSEPIYPSRLLERRDTREKQHTAE